MQEGQCLIHMTHILQWFPRIANALWPGGLGPGRWPLGPRATTWCRDAGRLQGNSHEKTGEKTNLEVQKHLQEVKTSVKTTLKKCVGVRENLRENSVKRSWKNLRGWNWFFPQGSKSSVKSPWKNLSLVKRDQKPAVHIFPQSFHTGWYIFSNKQAVFPQESK